jgi:hypothetical protein
MTRAFVLGPRRRVKEQVLRKLGDAGADTLARYWAQIEYTAHWCVRMLGGGSGLVGVVPEGGEDLVLETSAGLDLRQIKTRDESQGPWTTAEVIPVLCGQYQRGAALGEPCSFAFVSDGAADVAPARTKTSYGPLFRLKHLLDILREGQEFSESELAEFRGYVARLAKRIGEIHAAKGLAPPTEARIEGWLRRTVIETGDAVLRQQNNVALLDRMLGECRPGAPPCTVPELEATYDRLLLLIVGRITTGNSRDERRITRDDVLACALATARAADGLPNLDALPGRTVLDKKALYAGFEQEALPTLHRQRASAAARARELDVVGLDRGVERLRMALLDAHMGAKHALAEAGAPAPRFGPALLARVRDAARGLGTRYLPAAPDLDEQFCLGLLWDETTRCNAWWHKPARRRPRAAPAGRTT